MGDNSVEDSDMAATAKIEDAADAGTPSSIDSTPEEDAGTEEAPQEAAQPQKRKGGRKPVRAIPFTDSLSRILTILSDFG